MTSQWYRHSQCPSNAWPHNPKLIKSRRQTRNECSLFVSNGGFVCLKHKRASRKLGNAWLPLNNIFGNSRSDCPMILSHVCPSTKRNIDKRLVCYHEINIIFFLCVCVWGGGGGGGGISFKFYQWANIHVILYNCIRSIMCITLFDVLCFVMHH